MPITAFTRDGTEWTPEFLLAIDPEKCIGCGRCFKVCARNVMTLTGVDEDGGFVAIDPDDDDDDDGEIVRKVMVLSAPGACIGCGACYRVCPSGCQTHAPAEAA